MEFIKYYFGALFTNFSGYLVFISFALWGFQIYISLAIAYVISFVISQFINSYFVFQGSVINFASFLINLGLYICLYAFNVVAIEFGLSHYQINPFVFQFLTMFLLIVVNYFFQKHIYTFGAQKNN